MAKKKSDSIILKGAPIYKEAKAREAGIKPGHILSSEDASGVKRNDTTNSRVRMAIAIENVSTGGDKNEEYPNGENVHYALLYTGMEVQVRLAPNQNVAKGDILGLVVNGVVDKPGANDHGIGFALEASNVNKEVFIKMEVK